MAKNFVQLKGVQKTYDGETLVVRDLNLDVQEGEFLAMLDPSGFGKTTTLMMLAGLDHGFFRAARSLGARLFTAFRRITRPIIWPGVFSGALFAFATSFDEVVVVLFLGSVEQRTIPRQMWTGLREQLSPTILAAAVVLILISVAMLLVLEWLRRRNAQMRGLKD